MDLRMVAAIPPLATEIRKVNRLESSIRRAFRGSETEVKGLSAHPTYLEIALGCWR